MEGLIKRIPNVGKMILEELDYHTLSNFRKTSRKISQSLEKERFFWIRVIRKFNEVYKKEYLDLEAWKLVLDRTPVEIVKQWATYVNKLFSSNLLEFGVYQWSPLHVAAKEGNLEVCRLLMEKMENKYPNNEKREGFSPLQIAAYFGHLEICKLFMEEMENISDKDISLAFIIAAVDKNSETYRFFEIFCID